MGRVSWRSQGISDSRITAATQSLGTVYVEKLLTIMVGLSPRSGSHDSFGATCLLKAMATRGSSRKIPKGGGGGGGVRAYSEQHSILKG